ncbi:MAG TPA: lytic transglycosylase domain-containing protein [Alphaproteobacteria bacterium]
MRGLALSDIRGFGRGALRVAVVACVAILAAPPVAAAAETAAREDEASLSPNGIGPDGKATLPRILTQDDEARYRQILALQATGRWKDADREIRRVVDPILMGHVLAQRYLHPTHYRSRYGELKSWLDRYADHPDARVIHKLAMSRKPARAHAPKPPRYTPFALVPDSREARAINTLPSEARAAAELQMDSLSESGDEFDAAELDEGSKLSGARAVTGRWNTAVALFRAGRPSEAAKLFEEVALARGIGSWTASAGAFWAARANLVAQRPERVHWWLNEAARYPRTFYGLLAHRLLGITPELSFEPPELAVKHVDALMRVDSGRRAFALIQIGELRRAELELRPIVYRDNPTLAEGIVALAERIGLPGLAVRVALYVKDQETGESVFPGALYPIPVWEPRDGFRIDRAIVYAFMRQESGFNANARSRAGARGLMQLMPATARFIAGPAQRRDLMARLYEPEINLTLGQKYLMHLLNHETVQGDLFRLAAAYNGGPGNLAKWEKRSARMDDPLLFIESIPARETREFIERVLCNLWIYRIRMGEDAPSLDALAAGERPLYLAADKDAPARNRLAARNGRN